MKKTLREEELCIFLVVTGRYASIFDILPYLSD